ncbi:ABC transporter permease [Myxococcota bacterium]|nr:ABC transporter permease [Myxococcota bacterium]
MSAAVGPSFLRSFAKKLLRHPRALFGACTFGVFLFLALFGPWLVGDPTELLGVPHSPPSSEHWFGLNGQGQDVLAQTIVGARTSLFVGLFVGVMVVIVGALVGVTAGYFGGLVDELLSLVVNVLLVIPGLPLAIVIAAYLPAGVFTVAFVLIVTGWAWNARVLRSQALALRGKDFVVAAKVSGESDARIILRELLPNMVPLMVSQFIGATTYAIGAQVGLEFLGLGDVGLVTWGTNLYWASNDQALLTGSWWTFVPTGACVALVGFSLTLVGFFVDEISNPRLGAERAWWRIVGKAGGRPDYSTPVVRDAHG